MNKGTGEVHPAYLLMGSLALYAVILALHYFGGKRDAGGPEEALAQQKETLNRFSRGEEVAPGPDSGSGSGA